MTGALDDPLKARDGRSPFPWELPAGADASEPLARALGLLLAPPDCPYDLRDQVGVQRALALAREELLLGADLPRPNLGAALAHLAGLGRPLDLGPIECPAPEPTPLPAPADFVAALLDSERA